MRRLMVIGAVFAVLVYGGMPAAHAATSVTPHPIPIGVTDPGFGP